jgi:hypothetical protein
LTTARGGGGRGGRREEFHAWDATEEIVLTECDLFSKFINGEFQEIVFERELTVMDLE